MYIKWLNKIKNKLAQNKHLRRNKYKLKNGHIFVTCPEPNRFNAANLRVYEPAVKFKYK